MKRSAYVLIIAIILLLLAVLLLNRPGPGLNGDIDDSGMEADAEPQRPVVTDSETTAITVYYATLDSGQLLPLTLNINATTEVVRVALEKLLAGPPNDLAADSVPTDAKLLDVYSIHHTVYVDLTREFLDISYADAQLAVDAITATVLPLLDGYELQLLVEGEGHDYLRFVFIGDALSLPLINPVEQELRDELIESGGNFAELVCYRVDEATEYLIPETLPVILNAGQQEAQTLAEAALARMLPEDYSLISLQITDNVACVDMSIPAFTEANSAGAALLAEAIVRALTGISGIEAVQFMEQGQPSAFAPPGSEDKTLFSISQPINNQE